MKNKLEGKWKKLQIGDINCINNMREKPQITFIWFFNDYQWDEILHPVVNKKL